MSNIDPRFEASEFVLSQLASAGFIKNYAVDVGSQKFAVLWTNPKGVEFRQKFDECFKQLPFDPTAEEMAALMAIVSGMESL